jgi:hypothetical protein
MSTQKTRRTYDWHINLDPRSLPYKIARQIPALKARSRMWKRDTWLDQGQEGACTGFGGGHAMATTPRRYRPQVTNADARGYYLGAKRNDEWPGEDYEGSSVTGLMRYLKSIGLVTKYLWATTMEELIHAVGYLGPVVIGVNWYEGMEETDAAGYIHKTGRNVGGHCLVIGGVDIVNRRFFLFNSWGKDWGVDGGAWITFDDMAALMKEGGEFAVITKAKVALAA